jgi:hypothetical protein
MNSKEELIRHQYKVLAHVKSERNRLKEMEAAAKEALLDLIGDDYTGVYVAPDGELLFRRDYYASSNFDIKAFREKHPELAEEFTRRSSAYKLTIGE